MPMLPFGRSRTLRGRQKRHDWDRLTVRSYKQLDVRSMLTNTNWLEGRQEFSADESEAGKTVSGYRAYFDDDRLVRVVEYRDPDREAESETFLTWRGNRVVEAVEFARLWNWRVTSPSDQYPIRHRWVFKYKEGLLVKAVEYTYGFWAPETGLVVIPPYGDGTGKLVATKATHSYWHENERVVRVRTTVRDPGGRRSVSVHEVSPPIPPDHELGKLPDAESIRVSLNELIDRHMGKPFPPASDAQIQQVEQTIGEKIPEQLRLLWLMTDGFQLDGTWLVMPVAESLTLLAPECERLQLDGLKLVPIADFNSPTFHQVVCWEPMAGKIACHGGGETTLNYPSLAKYVEAALACKDLGSDLGYDLPVYYDESHRERSADDDELAFRLLSDSESETGPGPYLSRSFAIALFSKANFREVAKLMKERDNHVRTEARSHLSKMCDEPMLRELERLSKEDAELSPQIQTVLERKRGG